MLTCRQVTHELMDTPGLPAPVHDRALAGLRRINWFSGTARTFLRPLLALARREALARLSLLDVAAGGGDVPVAVARAAAVRGIRVDLTLLDRSPTALAHAAAAADRAGLRCQTICSDALALPGQEFDVVTCSLFLHHLSGPERVVDLLAMLRRHASRLMLVSDLRRSVAGLAVAWVGCRALSRSPLVHCDGPASVRAAFTLAELHDLAARAGMEGAHIRASFPFRLLLTWRREVPHGT